MNDIYLNSLVEKINQAIDQTNFGKEPKELYDPIRYMMGLGGKRLRPLLTLLGYSLWQEEPEKVLRPALAIEVFHNFTLMHDDVMDKAPLRRGQETVHRKWNSNIALLSGDVMLVKAYDLLLEAQGRQLKTILKKFSQCAAEVCEGQQLDMNFENRETVSQEEYLDMIRLKTAVLVGFSLELGGLLADAPAESCEQLYHFGLNVGIGFQLQDDLLDVYADKEKFGKQVGGDIISNKKTFLLINALEKAKGPVAGQLQDWMEKEFFNPKEKVKAVTAIYDSLGIRRLTEQKMDEYFRKGFGFLEQLEVPAERKAVLHQFTEQLIMRDK